GMPLLTDFGFLALTFLCAAALIHELWMFSRRWGLGGSVGFGGVLLWFCFDYLTNWFARDFTSAEAAFGPAVIAKAAFMHSIFICMMVFCLTLKGGKFLNWI